MTHQVILIKQCEPIMEQKNGIKIIASPDSQNPFIVACKPKGIPSAPLSADDKIKTNEQLNRDVVRIMALAEAYPELKSNESFLQLSGNLTLAEDEIAQSRKYYNAVVRDYNNKVEMIPSNIVAKVLGYKSKLMFAANVEERENVKVKL